MNKDQEQFEREYRQAVDNAKFFARVDDMLEEIVINNQTIEYWDLQQGTIFKEEWQDMWGKFDANDAMG